jgi:chemotaxis protein methyltransferase CheR
VKREWFTSSGRRHELLPAIRRMVTFAHLNLVEDLYPSPLTDTIEMDLILCRNVTIYFNQETTRRVVDRLHSCLADGGWLMVGHSEPCMTVYESFETVDFPDTMAYRKLGRKPANAYESGARIGTPIAAPRLEPSEFPEKWPERGGNLRRESPCGTSPDEVSAQAILRANEGRQGEAIESLSREEASEAENPRAPCMAARILLDRLELDGAEAAIRRAIQLSPLSGEAHYLLGLLFQERGDREAAIENFRSCLYADPGFVLGHFALANALDSAGQTRRAMKSLQNVLDSLEGLPDDAPIPGEEGLTVSRLRDLAKARKELMRP